MDQELSGRIALVTGGASGIGRAAALALARAGADVAFTWWTSEQGAAEVARAVEAAGRRSRAIRADLMDPAAGERIVAEVEATLGPLDILFANTGGLVRRCRVVDMPIELWNEAMALNVTSTFTVCKAALQRMEPRRRGSIVTMSSLAGYDGGGPGAALYAATKGAVATFTKGLAKEVGPLGIRVNGVAPGMITTRFHDVHTSAEMRRAAAERTPLRREGRPEEVAEAVVFLASDRSSFCTGELIQMNGGVGFY